MKPILFNTEMVRVILEGRKTVTRRVVKPNGIFQGWSILGRDKSMIQTPNGFGFLISNGEKSVVTLMYMPYRPGDILYVRETFQIDYLSNIPGSGRIHYKADDAYSDFTFAPDRYEMMRRAQLKPGWRPNENMPREAARIFLRVTDVRVERLQEISNNDLTRDFCICKDCISVFDEFQIGDICKTIWDSTIKPADRTIYGWDANPYVWVISFERISKEEALSG